MGMSKFLCVSLWVTVPRQLTVLTCLHCVLSLRRVLLRVRMLYYLKAEILGEAADKAFEGTPSR